MTANPVLVVMGVAGAGKTTVGELIAARLGWPFVDGDDLHPAANIEKMRGGQPLTDADRAPWLAAIGAWIDARAGASEPGVIACSALKRAYRDTLRRGRPQVRIVYLRGSQAQIAERLAHRSGHFWPAKLLASQFADLEEPGPDEEPIVVDIAETPEAVAKAVIDQLS
jgi:carbohydrate kinase (thermoresistant glucokinase family)